MEGGAGDGCRGAGWRKGGLWVEKALAALLDEHLHSRCPAYTAPVPPAPRRYNKEALRLRVFFLLNQPPGAASHTVLCQDVPGVAFGTIPNRASGTLLKFMPKSEPPVRGRRRSGRGREALAYVCGGGWGGGAWIAVLHPPATGLLVPYAGMDSPPDATRAPRRPCFPTSSAGMKEKAAQQAAALAQGTKAAAGNTLGKAGGATAALKIGKEASGVWWVRWVGGWGMGGGVKVHLLSAGRALCARHSSPTTARFPRYLAAADADNAAAAAALSTEAVQVNAATGRWELPDPWMDAVEGVRRFTAACLPPLPCLFVAGRAAEADSAFRCCLLKHSPTRLPAF